jgi:hypothetical protein
MSYTPKAERTYFWHDDEQYGEREQEIGRDAYALAKQHGRMDLRETLATRYVELSEQMIEYRTLRDTYATQAAEHVGELDLDAARRYESAVAGEARMEKCLIEAAAQREGLYELQRSLDKLSARSEHADWGFMERVRAIVADRLKAEDEREARRAISARVDKVLA